MKSLHVRTSTLPFFVINDRFEWFSRTRRCTLKMQLSPICHSNYRTTWLLWKMILVKRKLCFVLLLSCLSPECNMKPEVPINGVGSTKPRNVLFYIQLLLYLSFVNLRPLKKERITSGSISNRIEESSLLFTKRHIRKLEAYELPIAPTWGVIKDELHLTVGKVHIGIITVILMFH